MDWFYSAVRALKRWATTDPTPEQRAEEIQAKTTVGPHADRFTDGYDGETE